MALPDSKAKFIGKAKAGHTYTGDIRGVKQKTFKKSVLMTLYHNNECMKAHPVFHLIQDEFPTIADYLRFTKRRRYQDTACILQRLESTLMIDHVGQRLMLDHSSEPCQPIHDAYVVRESFTHQVQGLIKDAFAIVGLKPQVKIEPA